MNSLRLENLSLSYQLKDKNIPILNKINLQFEEGKCYAIVGQSGSGKTSLLNCIAGLVDYTGDILFNNFNIKDLGEIDSKIYKSRVINYLQQSNILFEKISSKDNLKIHNLRDKYKGYKWDEELLKKVSKNKKPCKLSGGEKRRIKVMQALNKNSYIVLCDEPTYGLDKTNTELTMGLLKEHCTNKILIFVTHDEKIANKYADEIITIKDGKIKKNYTKKIMDNDFNVAQTKNIIKRKNKKCSFKYLNSEKEYTKLFISNFSILLICLCLFSSIFSGFSNYFNGALNSNDSLTYVLLRKQNSYHQIDQGEFEDLNSTIKDNLHKEYILTELISTNISGEYFDLNPSILISPNLLTDNQLSDDELIISINESMMIYMTDLYECDDIFEYFGDSSKELIFELNGVEKQYTINSIVYDEFQESNILFFHSNPSFNETFFIDTCIPFYTYIDVSNLDSSIIHFIENTQEYKFFLSNKKYYVFKNNKNMLGKDDISSLTDNIIPLYSDNESFFIKYYNGLLYFNNFNISSETVNLENDLIYYTPYKQDLIIGRHPESVDEIVISKSLQEKLNIPKTLGSLTINYLDNTSILNVVGVSNTEGLYIEQEASWVNEYYLHFLNPNCSFEKTSSYMIVESIGNLEPLILFLKNSYDDYDISAPIYETQVELNGVLNKIEIFSYIFLGLLLIIVLFAIIIIGVLEKQSYQKHIKLMQDNGYSNKELNKIYFRVQIERSFICTILSIVMSLLIVIFTNDAILKETNIDDLLSFNYQQIVFPIITSIIVTLISFLFIKIRNKKNSI